jgi:hypothetical protein
MKRFQLLSGDEVIGETDLEMHDQGMNVYSGRFFALPGYYRVRPVFKAFADAQDLVGAEKEVALDDYFRRRNQLQLAIRSENGRLWGANWINVIDFDESLDDLQVEVAASETLNEFAGS